MVPPEIWIATAHFIPSSTLRNLYSVNSVFLNLALDIRYSDILLTVSWTRNTAKYLKHLKYELSSFFPGLSHVCPSIVIPTSPIV